MKQQQLVNLPQERIDKPIINDKRGQQSRHARAIPLDIFTAKLKLQSLRNMSVSRPKQGNFKPYRIRLGLKVDRGKFERYQKVSTTTKHLKVLEEIQSEKVLLSEPSGYKQRGPKKESFYDIIKPYQNTLRKSGGNTAVRKYAELTKERRE